MPISPSQEAAFCGEAAAKVLIRDKIQNLESEIDQERELARRALADEYIAKAKEEKADGH